MARISLTSEQRQAVEFVGSNLLVSAAAGSGKTAVLAERCAYLVCDAPVEHRCNVDELLVLTFTEAAAAEMRSRIVELIRGRAAERPNDVRLREQSDLADAAQISTIHAFCLSLVRRWFSEVGIDPTATVLDADEALMLRAEALDACLASLYRAADATEDAPNSDALASGFVTLLDDYGLGNDRSIKRLVLKLAEFSATLPDPEGWLRDAQESYSQRPWHFVLETCKELEFELAAQTEECERTLCVLSSWGPVVDFYTRQLEEYLKQLGRWTAMLNEISSVTDRTRERGGEDSAIAGRLDRFERVRREIYRFEFGKKRGPALQKDADESVRAARNAASEKFSDVKNRLFAERLRSRFCLFSVEEWLAGLSRTAPYVRTLTQLVFAFTNAYASQKRRLNVVDFSDLEQMTYRLLRHSEDPTNPSTVSRLLHRRIAHVMVDEFQDINPIQQAILECTSHESNPRLPANLFVVGDVKQSIYRFRLAEPLLFTEKLRRFRVGQGGRAIFLQRNFRSRPVILDAVNFLFAKLMRGGTSDVVYDEEATLRAGWKEEAGIGHQPVELHLLERHIDVEPISGDAPTLPESDRNNPAAWQVIEREACWMGSRILQWVGSLRFRRDGQPLRFGDIAVLLRAAKFQAEGISRVFHAMGIPAYAEAGGSLLSAVEIKDVLATLRVFDNFQQDIPLAALLRSGVLAEPFSEDEMVEIRCVDHHVSFHQAVREYAHHGTNVGLRRRLENLLSRIDMYRDEARTRPLADVLWDLYERYGYMAYAGGLTGGMQRRANLLKLHELARKFGSFRRQGLHRFLRFVEALEDEDRAIATAPPSGEGEDVVRIMTIHHAKGLEFPVVFVAGLGTRFNLGDRSGSMIFERRQGIGLRVVEPDRMIEYVSAAHSLVALEIERSTRAEELRILYVAMTRAKEKLVLVGSRVGAKEAISLAACGGQSGITDRDLDSHSRRFPNSNDTDIGGARRLENEPTRITIAEAQSPLDWILPVLSAAPPTAVRWPTWSTGDRPIFDVCYHSSEEISNWRLERLVTGNGSLARRAVASGQDLPSDEPVAREDAEVQCVASRAGDWKSILAPSLIPAVIGASEVIRLRIDEANNGDGSHCQRAAILGSRRPNETVELNESFGRFLKDHRELSLGSPPAQSRGIATHRVFQYLNYAVATDVSGVASELQRMLNMGLLSEADRALLDESSIAWFVSTPLAEAIRAAGPHFRREFQYISAEPPELVLQVHRPQPDDYVLVRGIVDGILPTVDGVEVLDFKTDGIRADEISARSKVYRPQLKLYARAVAEMWGRPVTRAWLVFLTPRHMIVWQDLMHEV